MIEAFKTYPMIWAAMFSWVFAQAMKLVIYLIIEGRINIEKLIDSGGMPSSHTALVISLCASIGLLEGWATTYFAIAAILAGVVIYDATGIRRSAGKQAAALNDIISQLLAGKFVKPAKDLQHTFRELLGHNPLEVIIGGIVGAIVTVAFLYGYDIIDYP